MNIYFQINGTPQAGFITNADQDVDGLSFNFATQTIVAVSGDQAVIDAWAARVGIVTIATPAEFASSVIPVLRSNCNMNMKQSDWAVIRQVERGVQIPIDIANARQSAIAEFHRLETAINLATTCDEINTIVDSQSWPIQPTT